MTPPGPYPQSHGKQRDPADNLTDLLGRAEQVAVDAAHGAAKVARAERGGERERERLEDVVEFFDYVMPMPYPSHWGRGSFGLSNPAHRPYETVYESLTRGWRAVADLPGRIGVLRSWIQAFNLDSSRPMRRYEYTPWHVREQIRACDDAGCAGWAVWNPRNVYDERAFSER